MENNRGSVDPVLFELAVRQVKDYAVFVLDPKGHVLTWNVGAERIKGYAPEEIIGRHFSVFYTRDATDREWPAYELKMAETEGHFEDEGWRVRKDGSRFWANVVITSLRDGGGKLLGFSKITRDLTVRRAQMEAMRQSEECFRLLVEGVTDYGVFMLDPDGMITSWNTGAQRLNGYTRDEIIGKHFSCFYSREDIEAGKPWEELAVARRLGRAEAEGWRVKKDGARYWSRAIVTALYGEGGRLRGFAKVTQDLSEKLHAEELEKAAKNLTDFLAVLAHELRNPLAPIRMAVKVMSRASADDPVQGAMRQTIDRQSANLARLVDDLMELSRITRGTLKIDRSPVDMADVVQTAIETARPVIEEGKHKLRIDMPAKPLIVHGDLARLAQVVTNLLNNAARYTPDGGSIVIKGRNEHGCAVLSVRDTGHGISPQMIERIFEMFVQGSPPIRRAGAGLGIGLSFARRIAVLHGDSLEAHSEGENKGSEFALKLPLADLGKAEPAPRAPAASAGAGAQLVARRILVVDDNVDAANTLEALLKSLGHETRVTHDGLSALEMAEEFRPDVILLDIGMPGLDGYEVARRLQNLKKDRSFRIVAVTGWGQEADRQRAREAGFDRHLVKPVDANELARVLGERNGATLH